MEVGWSNFQEFHPKFKQCEDAFGILIGELYDKLLLLFGDGRSTELKLVVEYFNIQIKTQLANSTCYKDVIDLYFKQLFYFELLKNVRISVPYILRELENCDIEEEGLNELKESLKDFQEHLNSYKIYFNHLSNETDIHNYEIIKIRALLKHIEQKEEEINQKFKIGCVLNEIITREEEYIAKLSLLLQLIESDAPDSRDIVGVMDKIYPGQLKFVKNLKEGEWDCDITYFIDCCYEHMPLFQLYAEEPRFKSAEIIEKLPESFKTKLKDNNLNLHMCIRFLMPYTLFFDKLLKLQPDLETDIKEIKDKFNNLNVNVDDLFAVANIKKSNIHTGRIGNLMRRCIVRNLRNNDHELYLFEDALIITEIPGPNIEKQVKNIRDSKAPIYPVVHYITHMLKENLEIVPLENNRFEFKRKTYYDNVFENIHSFVIADETFKAILMHYVDNNKKW